MPWIDYAYTLLIGCLFILGTITLVIVPYFIARRLLSFDVDTDRTFDVAGSVAFRIAALHGLILALVYAQELVDYQSMRSVLTEEAVAVADVYYDSARYGGPITQAVQREMANYTATVVDEEWDQLGARAGLSAAAGRYWNNAYAKLLDLAPQSSREKFLADRMLKRVTDIARFRQLRQSTAMDGFSYVFWVPAFFGIPLVAATFFVFPPTRAHIVLLGLLGTYSGVILFFILAFANPFSAPGRLDPEPFRYLLKGEMGRMVDKGQ